MSPSIDLTASKIDVASIVQNLLYVDAAPQRRMQSQVKTLQSKVSAYQALNTKISALADKVNTMLFGETNAPFVLPETYQQRFATSLFAKCGVTSSDEDKITATASNVTSAGAYSILVTQLATARSVASTGFADSTSAETGTGTLSITSGGEEIRITVTDENNTLTGVRDAINEAKAGVTATIVNDGASSNAYRLLIKADNTGVANSFSVDESELTGGQALGLAETQSAENAMFSVNGLSMEKSSNTISDVITGVTFTLKNETAGAVTLQVDRDTDSIVKGMQDFVSSYNAVVDYINSQFKYNSETKTSGVLSGESTLRRIQSNLQMQLSQSVSSRLSDYSVAGQIGLDFNRDGTLTLNESTLREALSDDLTGVAALFLGDGAQSGAAVVSDSRVSYNGKTAETQNGTYAIQITTLAEQASVTGNQPFAGAADGEILTIATGSGTHYVTLNSTLTLDQVVDAINAEMSGSSVTATNDSGSLKISTDGYGLSQHVSVSSSIDGSTGFGTSEMSDDGVDIAGTLDGRAAVGSGLTFTGAAGQPEEGLSLNIAQTTTGSYGTVTVASGTSILMGLYSVLDGITDPLSGPIQSAEDGLNRNIEYLNDSITSFQQRLDKLEEMYTTMYNAADEALKMLDVNQSELSSLLSSLNSV